MMYFYLFQTRDVNLALHELLSLGLTDYSIIEDMENNQASIGGLLPDNIDLSSLQYAYLAPEENDIWTSQWEQFAPNFTAGKSHIHLSDYGGPDLTFEMLPGAGFGDLSHPTTKLCLQLLCQQISLKEKTVIDIGSGSGVLSIAAALLGAKQVISIEIDPLAISHTKQNLFFNQLSHIPVKEKIDFALSKDSLIIMNMTFLEQKAVLSELKFSQATYPEMITSGILEEKKKDYIDVLLPFFHCKQSLSENGWIACQFLNISL